MTNLFGKANRYPIKALRGRQGGRVMYLTLPNQQELAGFFHRETESAPNEERVQRPFEQKRADEIALYVKSNEDDYVLGALTYAVDQDGLFEETEPGSDVGVLWLPVGAVMRSIDGQHRAGGVRELLRTVQDLASQHVAILIYVEPDTVKRKQMFSDMNSHQKRVSGSINIAFDTRDPFARVARRLAKTHPLLKDRIEELAPSVRAQSEKLYTLKAVYEALKTSMVGVGGRVRTQPTEKDILATGKALFDTLIESRPELERIATGRLTPSELRQSSLLASSPTLRVIAGGCRIAAEEKVTVSQIRARLRKLDFSADNEWWSRIGFTAPGKLMASSRLQELKAGEEYVGAVLRGLTPEDDEWPFE